MSDLYAHTHKHRDTDIHTAIFLVGALCKDEEIFFTFLVLATYWASSQGRALFRFQNHSLKE